MLHNKNIRKAKMGHDTKRLVDTVIDTVTIVDRNIYVVSKGS